ncbi:MULTISPECIES: phytanoyl-CoA dioxygenase family protein [Azotobacter]|uniref:phytanoyl-CoA dioxygenase family protein n=1 Tax=Azotobacter TaxID=352 RepID=UPI00091A46A1|nr:phytanoyl-CoA dioxygenase family protein [Azotobacter vinelandii]GLK59739.1 hypothetical protein GCM10017624_18960 [Azotobacter vinelandii]SFY12160.1 Ectoine hydroxylase-related dioxygenase, phytanoyl-CoA dioxygenase (PhyH) family [Azotobacter vinelandii]
MCVADLTSDKRKFEEFEQDGYIILRDFWQSSELGELQGQLDELGKLVVGDGFTSKARNSYELTLESQSLLYDRLRYLPALALMSGSAAIRQMCRSLGLVHPSLMGCCNMRLDKPHDTKHLFDWHQDTVYLLGSVNAVTVWVPLQDVNLQCGTIQVIPGSHRRGLLPFKRISEKPIEPYIPFLQRDISLASTVTDTPVTINAKRGDLVVFKQMLLHRSTPNLGDQIRWSAQLRITDLADLEYRRQRFPTGDRTNIFYVDYPGHDSATRRAQELGEVSE